MTRSKTTAKAMREKTTKRGRVISFGEGPLYELPPAVASARIEGADLVIELRDGRALRAKLEVLGVPRRPKPVRVWASKFEGVVGVAFADGTESGVSTDHVLHVLAGGHKARSAEAVREELRTRIAARIQLRRKQLGLTSAFVAKQAGLSRANLARMEGGAHLHQLDVLDRVADAMRTPLADFVSREAPAWAIEPARVDRAQAATAR